MSKKIVVLVGSPRENGNTNLMVRSFKRGAEEAGHTVTVFDTTKAKLDGCRHCNTCWSRGTACSCDDDFVKIAELLETCDVLVMAAPLYWGQFPSYIKAAIDKFYAYLMPWKKSEMSIKEVAVITCGDMEDESAFYEIVPWYQGVSAFFGWKDRGYIGIPKLVEAGDVIKSDGLDKAYELGKEI